MCAHVYAHAHTHTHTLTRLLTYLLTYLLPSSLTYFETFSVFEKCGCKQFENGEISGSHSDEYDDCLLGHCAMYSLTMEAVSTSETSVNFYQATQHNIPEDSHLQVKNGCMYLCRHRALFMTVFELCMTHQALKYLKQLQVFQWEGILYFIQNFIICTLLPFL
jgi:hypothetical protein